MSEAMSLDDDLLGLVIAQDNAPDGKQSKEPDPTTTLQLPEVEKGSCEAGSDIENQGESGLIYLEFAPDDKRNPINFSRTRKWFITLAACGFTVIACTLVALSPKSHHSIEIKTPSAAAGASYNPGFDSMIPELGCTSFQANIGLSVYPLGFGTIPLVTAAFSEEVGRQLVYLVSAIGFMFCHLGIALSNNIQAVIVLRFLQGGFGSSGAIMVGGTIADMWMPEERGLPMSIFSALAIGSTGLGPVAAGWIAQNPGLQWRWIQWISAMIASVYILLIPTVMQETRVTIILTRLVRKVRKQTGNSRYRTRVEDQVPNLKRLIWISCTRSITLLCTEPIVISFSLWIGFAWGIIYCLIESIGPVFRDLYNFSIGMRGTMFLCLVIPPFLGGFLVIPLERLYKKNVGKRGPEARLYGAILAGFLFPIAMFLFAWTAFPHIPWIAPAIGINIFMLAAFLIYVAAFTYLADCYGPFASSASAGLSLSRNTIATIFPLFIPQMFDKLGYNYANTIFGGIAALMLPIPLVLFLYGPKIRAHSKFSRAAMELEARMQAH